jgi:flotillin
MGSDILVNVAVAGGVLLLVLVIAMAGMRSLFYTCAPNEVLIFYGGVRRRIDAKREVGYRIVKGGLGFRKPLVERVDRMDLTNMTIDVSAAGAYSKGGIPLTVQGVANVKVAGHEPLLNNAIERFLGKSRAEIMQIAKATLEGSLRGILATMTPEQINDDNILLAERLVHEVEQDMTSLGLIVDTLKIQNVHDEVKYLDSIGRKKNAEVLSRARIAEAVAQADSLVRSSENLEKEVQAQITAQVATAKADAQRRLTDVQTRRDALVAEELATVAAAVAQAKAEVNVQKARVEQIRGKLEADVIQPAKASAEAAEESAKASTANIIEEGRARAQALESLAQTWAKAGPNAREVLLMQKLDKIIDALTATIGDTHIEKLTMIDSRTSGGSGPARAISLLEQIKQIFGVDVVEKLQNAQIGGGGQPQTIVMQQPPAPPAPPA